MTALEAAAVVAIVVITIHWTSIAVRNAPPSVQQAMIDMGEKLVGVWRRIR